MRLTAGSDRRCRRHPFSTATTLDGLTRRLFSARPTPVELPQILRGGTGKRRFSLRRSTPGARRPGPRQRPVAEPRLVRQPGRAERVAGALTPHVATRQAAQVVVQQLEQALAVSGAMLAKPACHCVTWPGSKGSASAAAERARDGMTDFCGPSKGGHRERCHTGRWHGPPPACPGDLRSALLP